jgi:hypothetical protein
MKKIGILLILMVLFNLTFGQIEVLKTNLLEMEQQIFHKSFSKKWNKTKKVTWEKNLSQANTVNELNTLFNEYSDLLAQSIQVSLGNCDATNEIEMAHYLIKVYPYIKTDLTPKWSESARKEWLNRLEQLIAAEELKIKKQKEKEEKERQMKRLGLLSATIKGFDSNFKLVYEDSKKNSFKNIRQGVPEGAEKRSPSKVNFSNGINQVVEISSEGAMQFCVHFDSENDQQLAEKMMEEMIMEMLKLLPNEFKKVNRMDENYVGNNKFVLEFSGVKFSDTAKHPTIIIGILKNDNRVTLEILEPIFGK